MSDNSKFTEAGKQFRGSIAASIAKYDQSEALLKDMATLLTDGVKAFYVAAYNWKTPDVYVEPYQTNQITIRYGLRPSSGKQVLKGPYSHFLVIPDGTIIHANASSDSWNWTSANVNDPDLVAETFDIGNWREDLGDWLIEFMRVSESVYLTKH